MIDEEKRKSVLLKKNKERKDDDLIDSFFVRIGWGKSIGQQTAQEKLEQSKNRFKMTNIDFDTGKLKMEAASANIEKILEKSMLKEDLEKLVSLPEYGVSDRRLKAMRKVRVYVIYFIIYFFDLIIFISYISVKEKRQKVLLGSIYQLQKLLKKFKMI